MVWLLDCWSIHKSNEFLDWMKENHSNTLVIFVLGNCTNVLQPTDGILQCPLKHVFTNWHKCKSPCGFQNEQLEAQNLWLVTSSMDGGENNETYVSKRLGKSKTYKGLGWWVSTCNIRSQYNNFIAYNYVGDWKNI
jgi:hypothetical protein